MLPRSNVKKLIAFSSIEHMGFILVGIGVGSPLVIFWVLFHTLAHALVKTLLFFSAGILHQQYRQQPVRGYTGMPLNCSRWRGGALLSAALAVIGMPLFPGFYIQD